MKPTKSKINKIIFTVILSAVLSLCILFTVSTGKYLTYFNNTSVNALSFCEKFNGSVLALYCKDNIGACSGNVGGLEVTCSGTKINNLPIEE